MTIRIRTVSAFILLLASAWTGFAQSANPLLAPIPPNRVGVDIGLNINSMGGSFKSDCDCEFASGSGNAFLAGGVVEMHLTQRIAVMGRLAMDQRALSSSQDIVGPQLVYHQSTNTLDTVQATLHESATSRFVYVTLTPMIRFDILKNLYVAAGPAFGLAIGTTLRVEEATDGGYSFLDGTSTRIIQDGSVPNSSAFRLGLDALLGYEYDLTSKFTLVPQVAFDMPITSLASDNSAWKLTTIQALLGLRWRFHV